MKKYILAILVGMTPLVNYAEAISESQAKVTAIRFFAGAKTRASRSVQQPFHLVWKGQSNVNRNVETDLPAFYVFNRGKNQGFIIISGDNALEPVWGYSDKGSFNASDLPIILKHWFENMVERVAEVRRRHSIPTSEIKNQWNSLSWGTPVVKLDTPEWDQEEPYNAYLPGFDGWHGYVGCTMTATAIVMGYHQWPERGEGTLKGYYTSGLGVDVPGITLGHPYHWEKMPGINNNILATKDTPEYKVQEDAISTLTRDLGIMLKARYDYSATSAAPELVPMKLVRHMKYHEGIMYLKEEHFSKQAWKDILKNELDTKRPIVFAGYKTDGSEGHTIVLEGYDEQGLFAINWGWSGRYNGFYNLESLRVGHDGPDVVDGGYSEQQEAIVRIQPNCPAQVQQVNGMIFTRKAIGGSHAGMGLHISDMPVSFEKGSQFTVSVGPFMNFCSYYIDSHVFLAVTDAKGNVKSKLHTSISTCNLAPGNLTMPFYDERDFITVTLEQPVAPGDRIRLLFPTLDGTLLPVTTFETDIPWEIVLKKEDLSDTDISVETIAGTNLNGRAVASFSSEVPTVPSDVSVEAFYAEQHDEHTIVLKKVDKNGDSLVIPANTGVILSTIGSSTFSMRPTSTQHVAYVPSRNLLCPTSNHGTVVGQNVNAYILTKEDNDVLFHVLSQSNREIEANRSFLSLPLSMHTTTSINVIFGDEVTGLDATVSKVNSEAPLFDLSGRQVKYPLKGGFYIKNGKKIYLK